MSEATLDDLEVGNTLPDLVLPPLQRETFAAYAVAANDHSPVHLDQAAARAVGFPDVFAPGMLVMAYMGRAVAGWATLQRLRDLSCRFVDVSHLNDRLICRGTVVELYSEQGERRARVELLVTDENGKVKARGNASVSLR